MVFSCFVSHRDVFFMFLFSSRGVFFMFFFRPGMFCSCFLFENMEEQGGLGLVGGLGLGRRVRTWRNRVGSG